MVRLVTNCSDMANEASELVRAFFPKEKVDFLNAHCHENVFLYCLLIGARTAALGCVRC